MKKYSLPRRQQKILLLLLDAGEWRTSAGLSEKLNVSDRTIRSDITALGSVLGQCGITIICERSKGYRIGEADKQRVRRLFEEDRIRIEKSYEDIHITLLMHLLSCRAPVDLDDLCEEFFVSRTSLEEKIKKIKNILRTFHDNIVLIRKRNTIRIAGEERSIRQLMNFLIINNDHARISLDLKAYAHMFDYEEMRAVQETVVREIRRADILISDTGIVAITIHMMVGIERIRLGLTLKEPFFDDRSGAEEEGNIEKELACRITDAISEQLHLEFNEYEIEAVAYHISFRRYFPAEDKTKEGLPADLVGEVKRVLEEIKDRYLMDMTKDEELIRGLVYHFRMLRQRLDCKIHYQNPILEEFKDKYPFVFELAMLARKRFEELLEIELNEDEIGYIAIHFGAAAEKLKCTDTPEKINLALISHLDYPGSQLLITKLRSSYGDLANIYGPFSHFDLDDLWDCDPQLIITTTDLRIGQEQAGIVKINSVLTKNDLERLDLLVRKNFEERKKRLDYSDFFREEFFYPGLEAASRDEVIHFMAGRLKEAGLVGEDFEESVRKRELFSSTVMKNLIALPHPMEICAVQTVIAVAILHHPVIWSRRKAQLIFMMAVKSHDQHYLESFYELVVDLSDDSGFVGRVLKTTDFESFLSLIHTYK